MTNDEKKAFNDMVRRFHKGCDYMDNPNVPEEAKKKWWPEFDSLMADMNMIAKEFKLSDKEMMEGFRL